MFGCILMMKRPFEQTSFQKKDGLFVEDYILQTTCHTVG